MHLSSRILGSTTVRQLAERERAAVVQIGRDVFKRADLAQVDCFNYHAAGALSRAVATLNVKDTRDLFEHQPPTALVMPHIGPVALAVLGACFERQGIGGAQPLEAWVLKHRTDPSQREYVTFSTLKHQEQQRELNEARARRQRLDRTHARRDTAQRLRGDRYLTRHGAAHAKTTSRPRSRRA